MKLSLESSFRGIDAASFLEMLLSDELAERVLAQSKGVREIVARESFEDGRVSVRTRVATVVTLPGPFKRLLPDGKLVYYEMMTVDRAGRCGRFEAKGEEGDERLRVEGAFSVRDSPTGVHRRTEFEIRSRVFGLGGAIEKLIAKALETDHPKGDRDLQAFIDDWQRGKTRA